jgi:hypothetical protein
MNGNGGTRYCTASFSLPSVSLNLPVDASLLSSVLRNDTREKWGTSEIITSRVTHYDAAKGKGNRSVSACVTNLCRVSLWRSYWTEVHCQPHYGP